MRMVGGLWAAASASLFISCMTDISSSGIHREDLAPLDKISWDRFADGGSEAGACSAGGLTPQAAACRQCIEASCCSELATCSSPGPCLTELQCLAACAGEASCPMVCRATASEAAHQQALELKTCWQSRCQAACAGGAANDPLLGPLELVTEPGSTGCGVGSCGNPVCADCDGDPSNGCEAELLSEPNCGACGRSCGGATCEPLAGCAREELVGAANVLALAVAPTVMAWIAGGAGGGVKVLADGEPSPRVVKSVTLQGETKIALAGTDLYWSDGTGLNHATLPAATDPVVVLGGSERTLLGTTATHVHVVDRNASLQFLWRLPRGATDTSQMEALGCALQLTAAAVDFDGVVYAATERGIERFGPGPLAAGCVSSPAGGTVLAPGVFTSRLEVGGAQLFFTDTTGGAAVVMAMPKSGGAPVAGPSLFAATLPMTATADGSLYLVLATESEPFIYPLVVWSGAGQPKLLASVFTNAAAPVVEGGFVYWADSFGIARTPR